MGRPKGKVTLDNKIAKAQEAVDKAKIKYETAKANLDSLLEEKKQIQLEQLASAVDESGYSVNELLELAKKQKK